MWLISPVFVAGEIFCGKKPHNDMLLVKLFVRGKG